MPLSRLSDILCDYDPQFQEPLARLQEAESPLCQDRCHLKERVN